MWYTLYKDVSRRGEARGEAKGEAKREIKGSIKAYNRVGWSVSDIVLKEHGTDPIGSISAVGLNDNIDMVMWATVLDKNGGIWESCRRP